MKKEIPWWADFNPEDDEPDRSEDTFEYLIERMTALHAKRFFLVDDYYDKKMAEYCQRLQEVQ